MANYKYFSNTNDDIKEMLEKIGLNELDELFNDLPESIKSSKFAIPSMLSEIEIRKKLLSIAQKNRILIPFLGGGSYDVYTPSVVDTICSRQEFLTSYTPYQPEISQGTLQYIFEFQSMICSLTGMDVANASMYDGATATAEAMLMSYAVNKRSEILVSKAINPNVLEVIKTYAKFRNIQINLIELDEFTTSKEDLLCKINNNTSCVIVQNPNYYGYIEECDYVSSIKDNKSLFIMNVDPSSLSILRTPKELGADIVCGDGQTLGIPLSFGGPYVGFLATTEKYMRKLPGRIVGMTNDVDGKRGYVLTLQAREQHIRREKATSNICSNQSLMALHTVVYMAVMGEKGLVETQKIAINNSHYLFKKLLQINTFKKASNKEFFKEFTLFGENLSLLNKYLEESGYLGGIVDGNNYILCATEVRTKEEIDTFVNLVEAFYAK